jgi:hypothetical protein
MDKVEYLGVKEAAHFETVGPGHIDVGQDQMHRITFEIFQGLPAIGKTDHLIPFFAQEPREYFADIQFIIHHHYFYVFHIMSSGVIPVQTGIQY